MNVLIDFTYCKGRNLIFISGCGFAISYAKEENHVLFITFGTRKQSCIS